MSKTEYTEIKTIEVKDNYFIKKKNSNKKKKKRVILISQATFIHHIDFKVRKYTLKYVRSAKTHLNMCICADWSIFAVNM